MKRREFLQAAAVLTAGASVLPPGWSMNQQQRAFLAAQPDYIDRHQPALFTAAQRATVTTVAEHIIPHTDTPGAKDAGVPRFIELMVSDWFKEDERTVFMSGLADLEQRANGSFSALPAGEQLELLEQLEDQAGAADWFAVGNTMRIWDEQAPFICQFKELTVLGFFLSEPGATQVLRENPMGSFQGDILLAENEPAYATKLPMRLMAGSQDK
jgi:gluconate 2-dehydrogenase gamma chain